MLRRSELAVEHLFLLPVEFFLPVEEQDKLLHEQENKSFVNESYGDDMKGTLIKDGTKCPKCGTIGRIYSKTVQRGWHNDHGDPVTSYRCDACDYRWREGAD
ncbi:unnamed protein product [Amoebophrya sp. A25]|nr:unnamed protein product [Amoebophrya sp. A25]|eukprot:GSA25T00004520001.1